MKLALMHRSDRGREQAPSQEFRVSISGDPQPKTLRGRAGVRVVLVFRREDASPAAERIIVPALGKSVALPLHADLRVDLGTLGPGEYDFTCEAGLLRGRLVLE